MLILTPILDEEKCKRYRHMANYHKQAFALHDPLKRCYFIEENSDSMLLLSRLFSKFNRSVLAYKVSNKVFQSSIPPVYHDFIDDITSCTGDIPIGCFSSPHRKDTWISIPKYAKFSKQGADQMKRKKGV